MKFMTIGMRTDSSPSKAVPHASAYQEYTLTKIKPSRRLESGDWTPEARDHRPETTEQRRDTAWSHRDSEITLGNEPQ